MGKKLYKVELTGWVVKDDSDADVMDWSITAITNGMVGFDIQTTLVDSSGWTHIPITTTTVTDQVSLNIQNVATPTIHFPTEMTTNEVETAMDIELDTKGMSL